MAASPADTLRPLAAQRIIRAIGFWALSVCFCVTCGWVRRLCAHAWGRRFKAQAWLVLVFGFCDSGPFMGSHEGASQPLHGTPKSFSTARHSPIHLHSFTNGWLLPAPLGAFLGLSFLPKDTLHMWTVEAGKWTTNSLIIDLWVTLPTDSQLRFQAQ